MKEMAIKKLDTELEALTKGSCHILVMKKPVHDALVEFCRQDGEFAQAVMQGGSFAGCMEAVAKGNPSALSDLEAYRRAVQFYFPGADISFHMAINLCGAVVELKVQEAPEKKPVVLDLFDLL